MRCFLFGHKWEEIDSVVMERRLPVIKYVGGYVMGYEQNPDGSYVYGGPISHTVIKLKCKRCGDISTKDIDGAFEKNEIHQNSLYFSNKYSHNWM